MLSAVLFILIVEALERFSFYGIADTETAFLSGVYYPNWNPGVSSIEAAAMTSLSTAIAYSAPSIGALLADGLLGDFWNITFGVGCFYIPGLILIALTTVPGLLGHTFNMSALRAGLLVLFPLGTGLIKSTVNVFGAKQFHPVLPSAKLQVYYVNFYLLVNVGSVLGGIVLPIIAQFNITATYSIPPGTMALGLLVFLAGFRRYVRMKPDKSSLYRTLKVIGSACLCTPKIGFEKSKESNGGRHVDAFVDGVKRLLCVLPISALAIPFALVYVQMTTTLIVQGTVMRSAGLIDASMMENADPIMVLIFGLVIGHVLYPALEKRGIHLRATHKFALGTFFATLALVAALIVEFQIRAKYAATGEQISVLWQTFAYACVGAGEVLTFAATLEATFLVGPKEQKALFSAINQFTIMAVPGFIAVALDKVTSKWFADSSGSGNITTIQAYSQTHVENFWYCILGIAVFGVAVNLLPPVSNWVERVVKDAQLSALLREKDAVSVSFGSESSDSSISKE